MRVARAVARLEVADQPHQRQQQRQVEQRRADQRRRVGGQRLRLRGLLEQVGHGDHPGQRGVLQHVDAVAGQRRRDDAQRLRQHHVAHRVDEPFRPIARAASNWPFGIASMPARKISAV